jgi:DNA-binding NarL/FixJ family response regulator
MHVIVCVASAFVRVGVRTMVDDLSNMKMLADTDNYGEALNLASRQDAGVIIILDDATVRQPGTLKALADSTASHDVHVVALVGAIKPTRLRDLLMQGMSAIIYSDDPSECLADALRAAATGGIYISPGLAGSLMNMISEIRLDDASIRLRIVKQLTPREVEVLDHVIRGQPNQEIASKLNVSEQTVKFHVSSILAKLAVRSRAQLISLVANLAESPVLVPTLGRAG